MAPKLPSQEEIDLHETAHVPYRSRCIHCRRCQGRRDAHYGKNEGRQTEDKNRAVSTWSVDYSLFNTTGEPIPHKDEAAIKKANGDKKLDRAVMAVYDRNTRPGYLHQTISKGLAGDYTVNRVVTDIGEAGYIGSRVVLKSDQVFSIVNVLEAIAQRRGGETVPQAVP